MLPLGCMTNLNKTAPLFQPLPPAPLPNTRSPERASAAALVAPTARQQPHEISSSTTTPTKTRSPHTHVPVVSESIGLLRPRAARVSAAAVLAGPPREKMEAPGTTPPGVRTKPPRHMTLSASPLYRGAAGKHSHAQTHLALASPLCCTRHSCFH